MHPVSLAPPWIFGSGQEAKRVIPTGVFRTSDIEIRRWIDTAPLPFFKELRENRPILVTPLCTLITLFDDVTEVLNMPRVFTVALYLPKMQNGIYLMAHDDDALHTREKSLMQGMLNRDDLPQVRIMVAKISKDLLDAANGHMDAINGYCRMVPATLVQDYFGLTGIDKKDLIEWSYRIRSTPITSPST